MVGDHLRNADRLLRSGEYEEALSEVEKGLALEPGNFYAQAYRDRITALREKHRHEGAAPPPPPAAGMPAGPAGAKPADEDVERVGPGSVPGGRIEEIADEAGEEAAEVDAAGDDTEDAGTIDQLKDQLTRDRAAKEAEARSRAEELARRSLEGEFRARETAERLRQAEQQAAAAAVAGAAKEAVARIVSESASAFEDRLAAGDTEGAFRELTRIRIVQPGWEKMTDCSARLDAAERSAAERAAEGGGPAQADAGGAEALEAYGKLLRSAWSEGRPDDRQASILAEARRSLGITPEEEQRLLPGVQREIMTAAMREAYREGDPDPEGKAFLERLARELSVAESEGKGPAATR